MRKMSAQRDAFLCTFCKWLVKISGKDEEGRP